MMAYMTAKRLSWLLICAAVLSTCASYDAPTCVRPSVDYTGGASVTIGGLFDIHQRGPDGKNCTPKINPDAIQRLEAFLFAINYLNEKEFIPTIKFGALAYDTCGDADEAVSRTMEFPVKNAEYCLSGPMFLGVSGPMYTNETESVASLLTLSHTNQISYAARGLTLSDKDKFPYFTRVVSSARYLAEVILDVSKEVGWTSVVLVVSTMKDSQEVEDQLLSGSFLKDICIQDILLLREEDKEFPNITIPLLRSLNNGVRGVILLTPVELTTRFLSYINLESRRYPQLNNMTLVHGLSYGFREEHLTYSELLSGSVYIEELNSDIPEFRNYFLGLDPESTLINPWFSRYWEQINGCSLNDTCTDRHKVHHFKMYQQAAYVSQTIASVFTFAQAFKNANDVLCSPVGGVCSSLFDLTTEGLNEFIRKTSFKSLNNQNITFDENGDLLSPTFTIKKIQILEGRFVSTQIAEWTPRKGIQLTTDVATETLRTLTSFPLSSCVNNCGCLGDALDDRFGKIDGTDVDLILVGIFDVHDGGAGGAECDMMRINEDAVQGLEAMHFAIRRINSDSRLLPDLRIGAVMFDSCRNQSRALRQVRMLLEGRTTIKLSKEGQPIPVAVIGGYDSHVTVAVTEMVKAFRIPVISYASTDPELADKTKHPYFMRTVASYASEARAIVSVLKSLKSNYITVFYSDSSYGRAGFREILKQTAPEKICVTNQITLADYFTDDSMSMESVIRSYLSNGLPESRVVVLITSERHTRSLLAAYRTWTLRTSGDLDRVIWIGSDSWGSRLNVVKGLEMVALGAITVGLYSKKISEFDQYMTARSTEGSEHNPWYAEYKQQQLGCYINSHYKNIYPEQCGSIQAHPDSVFQMSDIVPYVIDSVYTVAMAINKLISSKCSGLSDVKCINTYKHTDTLYQFMREVDFVSEVTKLRVSFDSLGNGLPRYKIFSLRQSADQISYQYRNIGNWSDDKLEMEDVNMTSPYSAIMTSSCDSCSCTNEEVAALKYEMRYEELMLAGFFPIHGRSDTGVPCSGLRSIDGFLQFMAFKYAVERVNKDIPILGNTTLGFIAFDSCSDPDLASIAFRSWFHRLRMFTQFPQVPVVTFSYAFIEGYDDDVTSRLAEISSTDEALVQINTGYKNDDDRNNSQFLSTVMPRDDQFQAVVDVLHALRWTCVYVIYENETERYYTEMMEFLMAKGICITTAVNIDLGVGVDDYSVVLEYFRLASGTVSVVIPLLQNECMRLLLRALNASGTPQRFTWIGVDMWAHDPSFYVTYANLMEGAVLIVPDLVLYPEFDQYLETLSPATDAHNPWITEFWEDVFDCDLRYPGHHNRVCSGKENLTGMNFANRPVVTQTIHAVYSYAFGLVKMLKDKCGDVIFPLCEEALSDPDDAYYYIRSAEIPDPEGVLFRVFTDTGNSEGRFKVINLQDQRSGNSKIVQVGEWLRDRFHINISQIHVYSSTGDAADLGSVDPGRCDCSKPSPGVSEAARTLTARFTAHTTLWGVVVLALTTVGILFTLFVLILFLSNVGHKVVSISTLSISCLILLGVFLMFALNLSFMALPSVVSCGCRRAGLGMSYAIIFSCLLVKAVRINKVHNKASLSGRPSFVSGLSQTTVALLCISVQVALVAEWLLLRPPEVTFSHVDTSPSNADDGRRCVHTDLTFVISLSYVYLLILVTLCLSLKARKATEFYAEARYVILASMFSAVILACCSAVIAKGEEQIKSPVLCFGITLNAFIILGLMFVPKIFHFVIFNRQKRTFEGSHVSNSTYALHSRQHGRRKATEKRMTYEHALAVVSGKYVVRDMS